MPSKPGSVKLKRRLRPKAVVLLILGTGITGAMIWFNAQQPRDVLCDTESEKPVLWLCLTATSR